MQNLINICGFCYSFSSLFELSTNPLEKNQYHQVKFSIFFSSLLSVILKYLYTDTAKRKKIKLSFDNFRQISKGGSYYDKYSWKNDEI